MLKLMSRGTQLGDETVVSMMAEGKKESTQWNLTEEI
jgi:hypothetical protein